MVVLLGAHVEMCYRYLETREAIVRFQVGGNTVTWHFPSIYTENGQLTKTPSLLQADTQPTKPENKRNNNGRLKFQGNCRYNRYNIISGFEAAQVNSLDVCAVRKLSCPQRST